jgi:hypothetical protein
VGADVDGCVVGGLEGAALEDEDESHAASRVLPARKATTVRPEIARLLAPTRLRTAETLAVVTRLKCAGPGAPHGAWPLVAADFGTRGCRGPACTDIVTTIRGDAFQVLLRNGP